jgi:hypothetical protein
MRFVTGTQVVFSTSIMYNNFVSLVARRRAAQTAREHAERVQVRANKGEGTRRLRTALSLVGCVQCIYTSSGLLLQLLLLLDLAS